MPKHEEENYIIRDVSIVALSIILALVLAKTDILVELLAATQSTRFIGSFLAGMFFVSVFTIAPATLVLAKLTKYYPIWEVALVGGVGALLSDVVIFQFFKESLTRNILSLLPQSRRKRLTGIFKSKLWRWLVPFIGALIVASPLPDELGLAMMGLSRMRLALFIPLSFALNFLGILI